MTIKTAKKFRRERRRLKTKSEGLLWSILRAKQLCGLKFRREHSIGRRVVDFACVSEMLVVEIDGGYHDAKVQEDLTRQRELEDLGWRVLRFTDKDVEQDAESVSRAIAKHVGLEFEFARRAQTGSGSKSQYLIRDDLFAPPHSPSGRVERQRGEGEHGKPPLA